MKIVFCLHWPSRDSKSRLFKFKFSQELFQDYLKRINGFSSAEMVSSLPKNGTVWVCEREKKSKLLSSEDLAEKLKEVLSSGQKQLVIVIGGADGFTEEELKALKPDLRWSFGPMTLPHELAAVVAAEQIYRSFCILKNHPYHQGHKDTGSQSHRKTML